jgi:hypothetical protein
MGIKCDLSLRILENRVLRRISGPKRYEVRGWRKIIMKSFIICTPCQILLE